MTNSDYNWTIWKIVLCLILQSIVYFYSKYQLKLQKDWIPILAIIHGIPECVCVHLDTGKSVYKGQPKAREKNGFIREVSIE